MKTLGTVLSVIIIVTLSTLGFVLGGVNLSQNQIDTLLILLIVCGSAALYCFVVGEISRNNSQMDKLWSILPIAYVWIMAAKGGMNPRLIVYAGIVTLWGIRLTFNFARKGAYSLKFWQGEEDYRWIVLRRNKYLSNKFAWAMFDLFFISIYQNALVLLMTLPMLAIMDSTVPFGVFDFMVAFLALFSLFIEAIADEQQWKFQETKKSLLKEGKSLNELELPYNRGFNTTGLWSMMRHPNYLGEQAIWSSLYLFTITAGVTSYGIFNWTLIGPCLIVLLFIGSSSFGEGVSSSKYDEYKYYQCYIPKYIPFRKYNAEKARAKYESK